MSAELSVSETGAVFTSARMNCDRRRLEVDVRERVARAGVADSPRFALARLNASGLSDYFVSDRIRFRLRATGRAGPLLTRE